MAGVLHGIKRFFGVSGVKTTVAYTGEPGFWNKFGLLRETNSGASVTPETAVGVGVVYACCYKIASTIASLPIYVYDDNGTSFDRSNHPADYLLNKSPDEYTTSFQFRETLIFMMLLYGCGYAKIIRGRGAEPTRFELIHSDKVSRKGLNGEFVYVVKHENNEETVLPSDMIALHYSLGQSPTLMNAETIGLMMAAQSYAGKFFNGGGVMNGVLTSDENLSSEQVQTLLQTWQSQQGKQTRFMPFGVKYHKMGVDPDKAQNVDSRRFQGEEICRVFNVPPAMVGFTGGAYKDYENQAKAFVTGTIVPLAQRIESEFNLKLLLGDDRRLKTFRHDVDELTRGDMATRADYYREMLQNGVLNRNEVRAKERYNAVDGGEIHTVQVNQIALNKLPQYSDKISENGTSES